MINKNGVQNDKFYIKMYPTRGQRIFSVLFAWCRKGHSFAKEIAVVSAKLLNFASESAII